MANAEVMIRRADASDAGAIARLINKSFAIERPYIQEPSETQISIASELEGGVYFVAIDSQDQLIGCVYVHSALRGIFKLAVEASRRRRGYGSTLMKEAESYCKAMGWSTVRIAILSFRTDLANYYRGLGYTETGEVQDIKPPARAIQPCHMILMSKELS